MASISTRSSVVAVKVEVTEGTPVSPTAAGDYLAIQDDFSFEGTFETLENAELKNSLAPAKSMLGIETPTASISHYVRHSGVEGQAPNYKQLLKAAFGAEAVAATEYDTAAGSTTAIVNVGAGEGATFQRGEMLLVKDGVNGYALRPIHSIATDAMTLGFELGGAPAAGVNLGKCALYYPADSGHQTLSVWHYIGNGGATQMIAGARVTSIGIEFAAGQLINAAYSLEGIGYYFNPIEITTASNKIDFNDGGGEENVAVTAKVYKNPHDLADAIASAMNAVTTDTISCIYSNVTGKFTISTDGVSLSLLWKTGVNGSDNTDQHIGTKIGFLDAADDSASVSYISDNAQTYASPQTPSFDANDPLVAKANQLFIGDSDDAVCINASTVSWTLDTPKADISSICSESGRSGSIINARNCTVSVTALLSKFEAEYFRRAQANTTTRFFYAFGSKSGGNWVPGKCGGIYIPTAVFSANPIIADEEGFAVVSFEMSSFVDDQGNGEVYLGFV